MEKKIIKTEFHQLPKHPEGFFVWKYKIEYYDDGSAILIGFWF